MHDSYRRGNVNRLVPPWTLAIVDCGVDNPMPDDSLKFHVTPGLGFLVAGSSRRRLNNSPLNPDITKPEEILYVPLAISRLVDVHESCHICG
jgi:hypothetical protein